MNKENFSLSWHRQWSVKDERPEKTNKYDETIQYIATKRNLLTENEANYEGLQIPMTGY